MVKRRDIMRAESREGGIMNSRFSFFMLLVSCLMLHACGGNLSDVNGGVNNDVILSDSEGSPENNLPINLQVSEDAPSPRPSPSRGEGEGGGDSVNDYSGNIVIKFKDGTDVRLRSEDRDGPFVVIARSEATRQSPELSAINELVRGIATPPSEARNDIQVMAITRVPRASEEEVDKWAEYWRKQGVTLHDWNLYYYLEVPDYEDAVTLMKELNELAPSPRPSPSRGEGEGGGDGVIEYSEILPVFYLTSVTTPDMSDEQGYLKSASEGGLGVEDAWAKLDAQFPDIKLRGQHTMVVDQEYDWNFDHEILPIDETGEYLLDPGISTWNLEDPKFVGKGVPANIEHGTAVVGIIAGQGNDTGYSIKGIVPASNMRVASIVLGSGIMGASFPFAEPKGGNYPGGVIGSIFTVEVQRKGVTTTASGCSVGDGVSEPSVTGCVPVEASKYIHEVIQAGVATGNIIVEGAGNGSVDLDTDAAKPKDVDFSNFSDPDKDSGAIMVGASLGANLQKAAWSNCGSRVDVFAWGAGVVTAGYGDKYCVEGANGKPCTDPDNPTKYTGQFGGTSAATAQIAGIAAMVQSYVRQLVAEAGYEPKVVYLDSKQMRTILKNSGQPAVYGQTPNDPNPNCNIGVQPDATLVIDKTNEFLNAGNVLKVAPLKPWGEEDGNKGGIIYDMDGDSRAELISFSRDHKWYIDLSSAACTNSPSCGADGYGAWDLILTPPPFEDNAMLFPVVNSYSYNYGKHADLSIYDSINGKWYIKYTAPEGDGPLYWKGVPLPDGYYDYGKDVPVAEWNNIPFEWDRVIDYSKDPLWKPYSRPVPGDYDGDHHLDIALQTPDGHWLIDYGGLEFSDIKGITINVAEGGKPTISFVPPIEFFDHFGSIDKDVKYLTDEQLAQAPGWAWLGVAGNIAGQGGRNYIMFKSPDGISDECYFDEFWNIDYISDEDFKYVVENPAFCGNDTLFVPASYLYKNSDFDYGLKYTDGKWGVIEIYDWWAEPTFAPPADGYGDILCRPISADYDGDGYDDRAVQCGTTWKIAYSSQPGDLSEIDLDQAIDPLPAFIYPGGIKYQDVVALYNYYKGELGGTKDSNIFDAPPPVGPYFAQCVKYWAPNASYCWDK